MLATTKWAAHASLRPVFNLKNRRKIKSEKKGSEAFANVEKKAPLSQPGLQPGSSAYATDALPLELLGPAHLQIRSVTPSHYFVFASQHKSDRKANLTISAPPGPSHCKCASHTDVVKTETDEWEKD